MLGLLLVFLIGCEDGEKWKDFTLDKWIKSSFPPPPKQQVAMAFDPDDADKRREGIVMLSSHDWGLREPYLKGYADRLKEDPDPSVRCAGVRALARAGDRKYLPNIVAGLSDESASVRWDAAEALVAMPDDSAAEPLTRLALRDASVDVRASSAKAMRHYNQPEVLQALVRCLDDPSFTVRYQAHGSLVLLTGRDCGYDSTDWTQSLAGKLPARVPGWVRPWWDWAGVTAKGAAPTATSQQGASYRPWWDWAGVTVAKPAPATSPATEPGPGR